MKTTPVVFNASQIEPGIQLSRLIGAPVPPRKRRLVRVPIIIIA
jgi:hypothetical protein